MAEPGVVFTSTAVSCNRLRPAAGLRASDRDRMAEVAGRAKLARSKVGRWQPLWQPRR
jgi:hypothetical protein